MQRHEHGHRPFVGRASETEQLAALFASSAQGIPGFALVGGEAGVGKTRLLQEFADRARGSGAQALWGSCIALGAGELPYAPLIGALRRLVRELGEAAVREVAGSAYADLADLVSNFSDGPVQEPTSQVRVFGAVLRLLDRLGAVGPVVLIFEDLHWADSSTLDLLQYLARGRTDERVLLVCSYRSSDLHPRHPLRKAMAELDLARRVHRIELLRFTRSELRPFLRATIGAEATSELTERVFALSDGNAFFAEELVAGGILTNAGTPIPRLTGTLREIVLVRVEALSDDARDLLRVAATAGRRVSHRLLAAVCELSAPRLLAALRECVAEQMLVTDPSDDTYVFRHALLREAVHQDLLPGERVALHAAMAAALTADPQLSYAEDLTVAAELSYHWFEAGAHAEALTASVRAGDTAMRLRAFPEAEQQYQRTLLLWSRLANAAELAGVARERLLASAADAARWSGHVERAVELVRAALHEVDASADPVRAGELFERLGSYLWEAGDSGGSQRAYTEASVVLAGQAPASVTARVLAGRATADVRAGRYSVGLRLGREAVTMARTVAARAEEGRALNTVGVALTMVGEPDEGVEALRTALRIAETTDHLEDLYRAYGNLTFALENAGRLEESVRVALEGMAKARHAGLERTRGGGVLANNASAALVLLGRWDEAIAILAEVVLERPVQECLYPHLTLAEIDVARGRFQQAEEHLTAIRTSGVALREPQLLGSLHACEAEQAVWSGRRTAARTAVSDGLRAIGTAEHVVVLLRLFALGLRIEADEWLRLSALPGRATIDSSRVAELADQARTVGTSDARSLLPEAVALRLLCDAEHARVDGADGAARWREVARIWDTLGFPYRAGYARWREAEAAAACRDFAAAARAARQAHEVAARLGAEPLRREIEALARHARLELGAAPVAAPPVAATDPFRLTQREREVLRHLCAGHSNRRVARALFISEKTASVHVSNILTKLGVTSRGEAAAVAHRLRLFAEAGSEPTSESSQ